MSSITLHSTKGVNPRLTCCRNCGKDVGLALLGCREHIYKCRSCGQLSIGGPPGTGTPGHSVCPKCKEVNSYDRYRQILDHEKLPIELCDECKAKEDQCADEVRKGGVYWKCSACHSEGALIAGCSLSRKVREQLKIDPPAPCGIEFDNCQQHQVTEMPNENDNQGS